MTSLIAFIQKLSLNKFYIIFSLVIFLPIFIFGTFIQDDNTIINLSDSNFTYALKYICTVNHNRPLSCLYHALLNRSFESFKIYFLIDFIMYFLSIIIIIKSFSSLINSNNEKKLFFCLAIIPFFSYTILYSPAMQSMGTAALFIWSISILSLKKYLDNKSYKSLFFSYFFILVFLLIYESPFPLMSISIFFPLIFSKRTNLKFFLINFLINFLIVILILYLQKNVFGILYDEDLSRAKLSFKDINTILYLIFVNSILIVNIFFHGIEIFFLSVFSIIKNTKIALILQILISFILIYSVMPKKYENVYKNSRDKLSPYYKSYFILTLLGIFFLTSFMHSIANTGVQFLRYNNRALVGVSMMFALLIYFLVTSLLNKNNFIIIKNISLLVIFIFLTNFLYFQNNLVQKNIEAKTISSKIQNKLKLNKNERNYTVLFMINKNVDKVDYLLSYQSEDAIGLNMNMIGHVINMTRLRVCNENYYNLYIDPFTKKIYQNKSVQHHVVYYDNKSKIITVNKNILPLNIREKFKKEFNCTDGDYIKISDKKKYLNSDDSLFIRIGTNLFQRIFKKD